MAKYQTPGVYTEEINKFPPSVAQVSTNVVAFIGYTEKAVDDKGASLFNKPQRISSLLEYETYFGGGQKILFRVDQVTAATNANSADILAINNEQYYITGDLTKVLYLYNSLKLFYNNGGGDCYILSVGDYETFDTNGFEIDLFTGVEGANQTAALDVLSKLDEPSLIVVPDAVVMGADCYSQLYTQILDQCGTLKDRFAIFDTQRPTIGENTVQQIADFRAGIGTANLSYGAAYYPWLKTTVCTVDENNIDPGSDILVAFTMEDLKKDPDYFTLLEKIGNKINLLPPSGAIAGVYTMVDNTRGVWKAPANVSLNSVIAPFVSLTDAQQAPMNIDESTGKSINAIRAFAGKGVLVWGARTLAGNDNDWRYISVRRTVLMLEESIKSATAQYVFEPNDANTWVKLKGMIENYLIILWKEGAMAGAKPEQSFAVRVGLGSTMTADDIVNGVLKIAVFVALILPAEFIVINFQQKMAQS